MKRHFVDDDCVFDLCSGSSSPPQTTAAPGRLTGVYDSSLPPPPFAALLTDVSTSGKFDTPQSDLQKAILEELLKMKLHALRFFKRMHRLSIIDIDVSTRHICQRANDISMRYMDLHYTNDQVTVIQNNRLFCQHVFDYFTDLLRGNFGQPKFPDVLERQRDFVRIGKASQLRIFHALRGKPTMDGKSVNDLQNDVAAMELVQNTHAIQLLCNSEDEDRHFRLTMVLLSAKLNECIDVFSTQYSYMKLLISSGQG